MILIWLFYVFLCFVYELIFIMLQLEFQLPSFCDVEEDLKKSFMVNNNLENVYFVVLCNLMLKLFLKVNCNI